jgi:hypothetical protein
MMMHQHYTRPVSAQRAMSAMHSCFVGMVCTNLVIGKTWRMARVARNICVEVFVVLEPPIAIRVLRELPARQTKKCELKVLNALPASFFAMPVTLTICAD